MKNLEAIANIIACKIDNHSQAEIDAMIEIVKATRNDAEFLHVRVGNIYGTISKQLGSGKNASPADIDPTSPNVW